MVDVPWSSYMVSPTKGDGGVIECHRKPNEIDPRMLGQEMDMAQNGNVALPVVSSTLSRQAVAVQSHAAKHLNKQPQVH